MAPSNLAVVGRYILTPRIFDLGFNVALVTRFSSVIGVALKEQRVLSYFKGRRFDCGSKVAGYLKAAGWCHSNTRRWARIWDFLLCCMLKKTQQGFVDG
jgi:UTP-glucose-1-phosphate uridylyltransferase